MQVNSALIVLCFASVLLLESQSAASFPTYLLAVLMLATVLHWNDVFREPFLWVLMATLGYLAASTLWSEEPQLRNIVRYGGRALLVFFFVVALAECQLRGQVQAWLARALALCGCAVAAYALIVFLVETPTDGRLRATGQLDTPIVAALILSASMIMVLHALFQESARGWVGVYLFAIACIVAAVYLSDSRNAWVSLATGTSVYLLARTVKDVQRFSVAVVVLVLLFAVLIGALLVNESTRDWLAPRGDSFRFVIWAEAMQRVWSEGLIFGLGIATPDDFTVGDYLFLHPHSMFLAVLYQGGLVALALFLALLMMTIRTLLTNYSHGDSKLAIGILAVALPSYLLDGHELVDKVGETWFLLWLPVAFALGFRWRSWVQDLHAT